MNPVKRIGRYQLPLLNVVAIQERQFTRLGNILFRLGILRGGYDVTLTNGHTVHFTPEEKRLYDEAMEEHAIVMQVWGMCKSAGLRA